MKQVGTKEQQNELRRMQERILKSRPKDVVLFRSVPEGLADKNRKDKAMVPGGIDLSEQGAALRVTKEGDGVKVNVDPALVARVEREGMSEVIPVIVNMRPANLRSLFEVHAN